MKRKASASSTYNLNEHQQDRLSSLPNILLINILSLIDTKLAVQSSILSKRWVNLWTQLPVLNFNSSTFKQDIICNPSNFASKITFDKFIDNVLARRNGSIKIEGVSINSNDHNIITRVFNYAVAHNVTDLSVNSSEYFTYYRHVSFDKPSDSLMRLSLKGMLGFGRFLGFSGLVSLRLERVKIDESEPFSCFVNLKELYLVNCKLSTHLHVLEVIAPHLSRLTIFSCFAYPVPYGKIVLLTPKLMLFELDGLIPMSFEASKLPVVDTVHIDCCISQRPVPDISFFHPREWEPDVEYPVEEPDEEEQKVNLIKILSCLGNAKCVRLSPSTVELLSLSHSMLVQEPCPFVNLKVLNLIPPPNKPVAELHPSVVTYLLSGSREVVIKALPR